MKISASFYIRSWLGNSLMVFGCGFILGFFSSALVIIYHPFVNGFIGAAIAFFIYQFISFDRFFGSRRGEFEYEYRNELVDKLVKKLVLKSFGLPAFIKYFQDQFNAIRTTQKDICQRLLADPNVAQDSESLYFIYYKLANLESLEDNFEQEKRMLNSAIAVNPNGLLANFRLAVCYEMDGLADDAIRCYKLASNDPCLVSDELRKYIISQIERIQTEGPRNRPPTVGARYQTW